MKSDDKPKLLILSFSDINSDARVLKQVRLFKRDYAVTTASLGEPPEGVTNHIQLPVGNTLGSVNRRYIVLKQYRLAYWRIPTIKKAWRVLAQQRGRFDVILSNDLDAAPLALRLKPRLGVHADLHEYFPALHDENITWVKVIKPWINWLISHYVARAQSVTTVSHGLEQAYRDQFNLEPSFVPNATPYANLDVKEVIPPIKLVHSGAGLPRRRMEIMLDAVEATSKNITLDLYLTANNPAYISELRKRYTSQRITFHDPVPYSQLVSTLNCYDVGIFILPPVNFSYKWALPNKVFDFIQARLGILVGPSPEMTDLVAQCQNGVVANSFEVNDVVQAIETLTVENVTQFKAASNRAAPELCAEKQVNGWYQAVGKIANSGS